MCVRRPKNRSLTVVGKRRGLEKGEGSQRRRVTIGYL